MNAESVAWHIAQSNWYEHQLAYINDLLECAERDGLLPNNTEALFKAAQRGDWFRSQADWHWMRLPKAVRKHLNDQIDESYC